MSGYRRYLFPLVVLVFAAACSDDDAASDASISNDSGSPGVDADVDRPSDDLALPPDAAVDSAPSDVRPLDTSSASDVLLDAAADQGTLPSSPGVYAYAGCVAGDPEAKFVGEGTVPATMNPGDAAAVWVVFANCGNESWIQGTGPTSHKLGAQGPQDNTHWGTGRVMLGADVPPQQLVRIDFSITAPGQSGVYGYRWQIVHEGVAWLGEPSPRHDVIVGSAPPTLADLWADAAHFVADQNPVPVNGPSSGHREAFAVNRTDVSPTTVYLYHRCFGYAPEASICLSISGDGGDSFGQFVGEVIAPEPGHIFSVAPAVAKVGSEWVMVYEESNVAEVYWASSSDGISWTKKGHIFAKPVGAWDSGANATPGIFLDDDGTIYVFYAGFVLSGSSMSIGYASGSSMTSLTRRPGGPVLGPGAGWNAGQVSMGRVVKQGGTYYMIHEGATIDFTCEAYNKYGWGIARSTDLQSWTPLPQNPLGQAINGCGNDMPSIFIRYDGWVFAYHTSQDTKNIVRERLVWK